MSEAPLDYEQWFEKNDQDLTCEAAETGADREGGFSSEDFAEERYQRYLVRHELISGAPLNPSKPA